MFTKVYKSESFVVYVNAILIFRSLKIYNIIIYVHIYELYNFSYIVTTAWNLYIPCQKCKLYDYIIFFSNNFLLFSTIWFTCLSLRKSSNFALVWLHVKKYSAWCNSLAKYTYMHTTDDIRWHVMFAWQHQAADTLANSQRYLKRHTMTNTNKKKKILQKISKSNTKDCKWKL